MKNCILVFLSITIFSCTSNTIFKKPDDLIPKEKMVELLTDLYIAKSCKPYKNKLEERNIDYTFLVYEKHGIDSARFRRSNFYYTTKIDEYEEIYLEVEKEIEKLKTSFVSLKKIKDSIIKDSVAKVQFVKDSILKIEVYKDSVLLAIINKQTKDSTKRYDLSKVIQLRKKLNMDSLRKANPIEDSETRAMKIESSKSNPVELKAYK